MAARDQRLTVLQAKFAAYLSWSQPFLHVLISRLDPHVRNVILCNQTENLARFPVKHVERFPNRYLVKPRLCVLSASYLRRTWSPDLIHAHFGWSGLRLILLKQMLRVPMVVTFGGRDVGLQMNLPDFDRLYEAMLDAADQIICVSQDLRDKVVAAGVDPDRIQVIYRGADMSRFEYVDRSDRGSDRPVRVLMVGRIVEKKGHRYALEALEPLVTEGRKVRITIVGEGEAYHEVRRMRRRLGLTRHVEFAGPTDHEGVRRHMREADLLLHCSVTSSSGDVEGIPNVVVEAQAMGLPVIGTVHGGISEAIRDGETGLLVPERAAAPLEAALRKLVDDPAYRLRLGRQARAFVEEHFNLDRQVEQHLAIYEKVVARAAADPEWKRRNWLPEDYYELIDRTILARGIRHPTEFSIAELLERLVWARRLERRLGDVPAEGQDIDDLDGTFLPDAARLRSTKAPKASGGKRRGLPGRLARRLLRRKADAEDGYESTLEQLYNLKVYMPQTIKFPMKMTLGRILVWAIESRQRRRHGAAIGAIEDTDRRIFRFFREGGQLAEWEARRGGDADDEAADGCGPSASS
jgi:glycosyltransferase involved in cell wall biosynthesis